MKLISSEEFKTNKGSLEKIKETFSQIDAFVRDNYGSIEWDISSIYFQIADTSGLAMYMNDPCKYVKNILELRNALAKKINEHFEEYMTMGISVKKITPPVIRIEDLKDIKLIEKCLG